MRIRTFALLFLLAASLLTVAVPSPVLAEEKCFCNLVGIGATPPPGSPANGQACRDLCAQDPRSRGAQWALDASGYPDSLLQCFKEETTCTQDLNQNNVPDGRYDSAYQPAECLPNSHYCYANDAATYDLQISIPNGDGEPVTTVKDYGQYVGIVYRYLMGISVTIAIVFVMIGGIRYVVGATTGEIGKAKDMIVKAVSGLALLLFAYVILYTVNPRLINLEVPQLPMLRRVEILTGGESCEYLQDEQGYTIDYASATAGTYGAHFCGSIAAVTIRPDGSPAPEGTTCTYENCSGKSEPGANGPVSCIVGSSGGRCVSCEQVIADDSSLDIVPNAAVCSKLDPADTFVNVPDQVSAGSPAYDVYNTCGWTQDPTMHNDALAAAAVGAVAGSLTLINPAVGGVAGAGIAGLYTADVLQDSSVGSCAALTIDCKTITACTGYNQDSLQVKNKTTDNELNDLTWSSYGNPNIVSICNDDPCGAALKMVDGVPMADLRCQYYEGSGCFDTATGPPAAEAPECDDPEHC